MCKRVLSMLLCLAMVMSFVPVASAQEIVADTNAGQNILEDGTIHYDGAGEVKVDKDGNITITESGKTPEPTLSPIKIAVAECDCGKGDADLLIHSDNCALKDYCVELAASDANAIYQAWFGLPANARDAIYADLTENYPDTLTELRVKLDAAVNGWEGEVNEEYEDDFEEGLNLLPGSASTVVDGVTVNAEGLPEDSSLTVKEPSKQVMNAVEDAMEDVQETPHELFVYDISVQNDESSDWQPDGTDVLMTLTVPGVKLHKYATVKVVHVDDEGNTSFIEAGVDEDGNIVFATEGFSTFYGFTVDFEYGTAMFSIPGKSSIKISEMLDQLRMPLNAEDVVDVKFTDYSLLTVERLEEEQDWLLTSLKAFTTHETLTLTMNDGTIYEIKVTDATVQIKVGANGEWKTDSNNTTTWFCDGDGDPSNSRDDDVANPAYYSPDTFIYVGGTGTFTFAIQPADHCTTDGSRTYLTMKGIRISGGADVVFRIGGWFKDTSGGNTWGAGYSYYGVTNFNNIKEVVVQASANENLFSVYDGSLTLECEYSGIEWVLNGYNNDSKTYNYAYTNSDCGPIRMYDGAKSFVANKVRFRNIQRGAIVLSPAAMTEFKMTNCVFEDTVSRTTYGGAIYLQQAALTVNQSTYASSKKTNSKGENYYSSIDKFTLENVDFYGNHAETGGAIVLRGRVYEINIDSACLFDGCQTKSLDTSKTPKDGGAIYCDAAVGEFKVSAEFKNCTASRNGGAICVETTEFSDVDRKSDDGRIVHMYSRINHLNLQGAKFTGCKTTQVGSENHGRGGAIDVSAQVHTIDINNCLFDSCSSVNDRTNATGGAISFGYANLPSGKTAAGVDEFSSVNTGGIAYWSSGMWISDTNGNGEYDDGDVESGGSRRGKTYTWVTTDKSTVRTTIGTVNITGTTKFLNCTSAMQGGAFIVRTGACIDDLNMTGMTIDGCKATAGAAIYFNNCIVTDATFENCIIKNCGVPHASGLPADASDNVKSEYDMSGTVRTTGNTTMVATFNNCTFQNNTSSGNGGGLYWNAGNERKNPDGDTVKPQATVKNCTFTENSATGVYGGGVFCEGTMSVSGCTFDDNYAPYGGGLAMGVYNSDARMMTDDETTQLAFDTDTTVTKDTTFYDNTADYGGGIYLRANATIALKNEESFAHTVSFTLGGAKIFNNTANIYGGGVCFVAAKYIITDADDEASRANKLGNQAEVDRFTKTIILNSGEIYGNTAGIDGGGIYMDSSNNTSITISDALVYSNIAGNVGTLNSVIVGGNGGGIYLTGTDATVSVTGGTIGGLNGANSAASPNIAKPAFEGETGHGGNGGGIAVYNGAKIEMTGGTISYNEAYVGGGIAVRNGSVMTSDADTSGNYGQVIHNKASSAGGGIAIADGSAMIISNGKVNNNEAAYGGGISVIASSGIDFDDASKEDIAYGMIFNGGEIKDNYAVYERTADDTKANQSYGGGVCLTNKASMYIHGGVISGNKALERKISIASDGTVTVLTAEVYNDGEEGGGIAVCGGGEAGTGSTMTIDGGKISDNMAYNGGGIAVRGGSTVSITGSVTINEKDEVTASDGSVQGNTAQCQGAGIYIANGLSSSAPNTVTMDGGWVYNNHASNNGGGIFVGKYNSFTISGGRVESNSSATWGGGLYGAGSKSGDTYLGAFITVDGGRILKNTALNGAGICLQNYAVAEVNDGYIYSNTATGDGGGIFLTYSSVTIKGGEINNNTAKTGGGVSMTHYSSLTMSTSEDGKFGKIYTNTANDDGGAVSANQESTVSITNGEIYSNNASDCGGGLYGQNSSELTVSGGVIRNNTATKDGGAACILSDSTLLINQAGTTATNIHNNGSGDRGGAIYAEDAEVTIEGGNLYQNKSNYGGGVFLRDSAYESSISGGHIYGNEALQGAGLFFRHVDVTISGGYVHNNTATENGGGYRIDSYESTSNPTEITINGGSVYENSAPEGAGLWVNGPHVTTNIYGGRIYKNNAKGFGGGVFARDRATVLISKSTDTIADISENIAYNGGGVFVTRGASLTVSDGHITDNMAVVPESATVPKTGYQNLSSLYGAGGGVCVANYNSTDLTATFSLIGNDMAIYNNRADLAGDDVFSNGQNTDLTLPKVAGMNLVGYELPAIAWVEDYVRNDTAYTEGMNLAASGQDITNGKNVYRYRDGRPFYRVLVPEEGVADADLATNVSNEYVAVTLGIPSAQADTVVIDFGLPVIIDVLANDFGLTNDGVLNSVGNLRSAVVGTGVDFSVGKLEDFIINSDCLYGTAVIENATRGTAAIRYTPNSISMVKQDAFSYAIQYNHDGTDYYFYSSVTVIPATSIYYEDNLTTDGTNTVIKYESYKLNYDDKGNVTGETGVDSQWTTVDNGAGAGLIQDQDRPGSFVYNDENNIYGYDDAYDGDWGTYSMDGAHMVTVNKDYSARAKFTFTGTGFDVISMTNYSTGLIIVTVTSHDKNDSSFPKYYVVDTYYGYVYDAESREWIEKNWTDEQKQDEANLYQIPVIKGTGYPYGTYDVDIYIAYSDIFDHTPNDASYTFFLDGIRVYDPAGDGVWEYEDDGETKQDTTIQDAYVQDGEYDPSYTEIRDLLINPNNDTSFQEGTTMNGAVFIDGVGAVNGSTNASLKNYVHYGPNNELYLNKGQSVSFKLDFTGDVARVYLGMKRLLNAGSITIAVLDAQGKESSTKVITLNSKSELFYDLSAYNGYTIVIRNSSAADNALISLTNFKVTHIPTNTSEGGNDNQSSYSLFSMDMETANQVVSYLTNITIIPPVVDLDYPTISFEDEIFYNVYFNVDDLSNISEMGLITFESKLADGTIADAKEVIPGYSVVGDCYTVRTNGISAKNMGDTVYFKVYAKLTDGSYVYSDIAGYNAVAYANTVLNSNASAEAKALVVAMLNYGAAAQTQFGYKTDSLMNASLTAEQQALVQAYSDSMVSNVISCEKPGSFVHNGGYTKVYPTVSFEGAFAINYYFNTAYTPDSAPVFYYWDAETYSNAEELTAENATGIMEMVLDGNSWVGIVDGISAKQIDQTFYTAAVYSVDGVSYYSPVVSYSLGAYCKSVAAQGNALGAAAAVYGYYAASYFNN